MYRLLWFGGFLWLFRSFIESLWQGWRCLGWLIGLDKHIFFGSVWGVWRRFGEFWSRFGEFLEFGVGFLDLDVGLWVFSGSVFVFWVLFRGFGVIFGTLVDGKASKVLKGVPKRIPKGAEEKTQKMPFKWVNGGLFMD